MIETITTFSTVDDLIQITKLSPDALISRGFELEDLYYGICVLDNQLAVQYSGVDGRIYWSLCDTLANCYYTGKLSAYLFDTLISAIQNGYSVTVAKDDIYLYFLVHQY